MTFCLLFTQVDVSLNLFCFTFCCRLSFCGLFLKKKPLSLDFFRLLLDSSLICSFSQLEYSNYFGIFLSSKTATEQSINH